MIELEDLQSEYLYISFIKTLPEEVADKAILPGEDYVLKNVILVTSKNEVHPVYIKVKPSVTIQEAPVGGGIVFP